MALISAATSCWKAAPEVHPSVWGDFFINYIPEPLQACVFIATVLHKLLSSIAKLNSIVIKGMITLARLSVR